MARIGGPFGIATNPLPVQLAGGQAFYPPAGDYLCSLGSQTICQYWDQNCLTWRNMSTPIGSDPFVLSTDGFNLRLLNASGVVQGCAITNAGSGALVNGIGTAVTGVAVTIAAPATGIQATAYPIIGGAINSTIAITSGGSGFVSAPVLVFDPPPPGGICAAATCTISAAGVINAVTVTNPGAGYVSAPNCYIIPQWATYPGIGSPVNPAGPPGNIIPPGNLGFGQPPYFPGMQWPLAIPVSGGAVLTVNPVLAGSGTLTGIVMTNWGAGYLGTAIPAVSFAGGSLAGGVAATALMSMALQSITITSGGVAYTADTHIIESNLGLLLASTGVVNNNTVGPRCARGRCTQSGGVINATVIEDAGFGFQLVPRLGVVQTSGVAATTVANLTAVVGGVTDISLLQPGYNT